MSSSLNQNTILAKNNGSQSIINLKTDNGRHLIVNNQLSMNMNSINSNATTIYTKSTGNQRTLITTGNSYLTTMTGTINLESNNTSAQAIHINSNHSSGGITINAGTTGISLNTTGPIALDSSGNVTIGGSNTTNITFDAINNINLSSDFINLVATDDILLQTSSGGEILFDTNGVTTGVAMKVTDIGTVLIGSQTIEDNYQLEVTVTEESNNYGINGIQIISNNIDISNELRINYADTDGSHAVINTIGCYSSNSSVAKYRDYIGFRYSNLVINMQGKEFTYNDIGKKIYFVQDNKNATITGLSTIILPIDTTFAPNTVVVGGIYTGTESIVIKVEIDGITSPSNTFRWSTNSGATWNDTFVPISWALNQRYPLINGIYISFNDNNLSPSPYKIGEFWTIFAKITAQVDTFETGYDANTTIINSTLGTVVLSVSNNTPTTQSSSYTGSNVVSTIVSNTTLSNVQAFYINSPYNAYLGTTTNSDLIIKTADTERFRVTADGSIGVASENIDARLRLTSNYNAPLLVNDNTTAGANLLGYQQIATSTDLNNGGYVIAYESQEWDTANYNIYGTYFTSNGDKIGTSFMINETTTLNQIEPHITKSGNILLDDYIVVWTSGGSGVYQIRGRIFHNGNEAITGDIIIASAVSNVKITPRVAGLKDGNYIITYADYDGSKYSIKYVIISASGAGAGTIIAVTADASSNYIYPFVSALSSYDVNCPGGFVLVYQKQLYPSNPRYQLMYNLYTKVSGTTYTQAGSTHNITNTGTDTSITDLGSFTATDGLVSVTAISDAYAKTTGGFIVAYSVNFGGTYDYSRVVPPSVTIYGASSGANGNLQSATGPNSSTGIQTLTVDSINGTFLAGETITFEGDDGTFIEKIASIANGSGSTKIFTLSRDPKNIIVARFTSANLTDNLSWRTTTNTNILVNDRLRDLLNPLDTPLDFITQNTHFYAFRPLPVIASNGTTEVICVWQNGFEPNIYYRRLSQATGTLLGTEDIIAESVIGMRQVDPYVCSLKNNQGYTLGYSIVFTISAMDLSKTGIFQQLIAPYANLINISNQTGNIVVDNSGKLGLNTNTPNAMVHIRTLNTSQTASIHLENRLTDRIETTNDMHTLNFFNGNLQEMARIKVKYSDNYQNLYPNAENLVTYLKFDELSGSLVAHDSGLYANQSILDIAEDVSILSQTAVLNNFNINTCWVTGKVNNGLLFDGIGSYLSIPAPTLGTLSGSSPELNALLCRLGNNATFAVSMWLNIDTNVFNGTRMNIFSIGTDDVGTANGGGLQLYLLDIDSVGRLHPVIRYAKTDSSIVTFQCRSDTIRINNSAWHHIVINYVSNILYVWLDGVLLPTSSTVTTNIYSVSTNLNVYIGAGTSGSSGFFRGIIDELRFYKSSLATTEIAHLYRYGNQIRSQLQIQTLGDTQNYYDYEPGFVLDDTGSILSAKFKNNVYRQLSGTLVTTYNSSTITGINTLFTEEVRPGDFLYLDNKINEVDDTADKVSDRSFKVISVASNTSLQINRVIPSILSGETPTYFKYAQIRPYIVSAVNLNNDSQMTMDFFGDMVLGSGKLSLSNSRMEIRGTGTSSTDKTGLCISNSAVTSSYLDYGRATGLSFAGYSGTVEAMMAQVNVSHAGTGTDNLARMRLQLNDGTTPGTLTTLASFYGDGKINLGPEVAYTDIIGNIMLTGQTNNPFNIAHFSKQRATGIFTEASNISFYGVDTYDIASTTEKSALARISVSNDARIAGSYTDQVPAGRIDLATNNYTSVTETGIGPQSRLCVTASGNIGIHTQRPLYPLQVSPRLTETDDLFTAGIVSINGSRVVFNSDLFVSSEQQYKLLRGGTLEIFDGSNLNIYNLTTDGGTLFSNAKSITLSGPPTFALPITANNFRINYPGLTVNKYGLVNIGNSTNNSAETYFALSVSGPTIIKDELSFASNITATSSNVVAIKYGVDSYNDTVLQLRDESTNNEFVNIFRGPVSSGITTVFTTPTTISWTDATVLVDTTASAIILNLPEIAPEYIGRQFTFKLVAGSNSVTINAYAGDAIDGASSLTLATLYKSRVIQTDGTNWYILSGYL